MPDLAKSGARQATQHWILERTPVADEFRIRQVGGGNDVVLPEDDRRYLDAYQTAGEDFRVVNRTNQFNDTQVWIIEDCCPADFDCSGSVGIEDLLAVLSNWGECNATCGRGCLQFVGRLLMTIPRSTNELDGRLRYY